MFPGYLKLKILRVVLPQSEYLLVAFDVANSCFHFADQLTMRRGMLVRREVIGWYLVKS